MTGGCDPLIYCLNRSWPSHVVRYNYDPGTRTGVFTSLLPMESYGLHHKWMRAGVMEFAGGGRVGSGGDGRAANLERQT